jgi:hypothetical protein
MRVRWRRGTRRRSTPSDRRARATAVYSWRHSPPGRERRVPGPSPPLDRREADDLANEIFAFAVARPVIITEPHGSGTTTTSEGDAETQARFDLTLRTRLNRLQADERHCHLVPAELRTLQCLVPLEPGGLSGELRVWAQCLREEYVPRTPGDSSPHPTHTAPSVRVDPEI